MILRVLTAIFSVILLALLSVFFVPWLFFIGGLGAQTIIEEIGSVTLVASMILLSLSIAIMALIQIMRDEAYV